MAHLNGSTSVDALAIELIQFETASVDAVPSGLFTTSISEVCFQTDDIEAEYACLCELGVECLSEPRLFGFTEQGLGASRAFDFRDSDGIVLEMMQAVQLDWADVRAGRTRRSDPAIGARPCPARSIHPPRMCGSFRI